MNDSPHKPNAEQMLQRHQGIYWKVARTFADTHADEQDLAQEIVITVWNAIDSFDGQAKESTFVYRVALNRAITWQRRKATYDRHLKSFGEQHRPSKPDIDTSDTSLQLKELYAAIRRLPDADRSLVLMHLDRLSYREISDVMGISESNVGARLSRIRKRLAADLVDGEQTNAV